MEAEFYGLVRSAGQGLGLQGMLTDLGVSAPLEIYGDSEGAHAVVRRRGVGRLRHVEIQALWIQERLARGDFLLRPVRGAENPAGLFTKFVPEAQCLRCLERLGASYVEGRATSAPTLCG